MSKLLLSEGGRIGPISISFILNIPFLCIYLNGNMMFHYSQERTFWVGAFFMGSNLQAMERNILSRLLGGSPNPRPDKNMRAEHHAGHGGLRVQKDASLPEA